MVPAIANGATTETYQNSFDGAPSGSFAALQADSLATGEPNAPV